ncbi:MAG TPA: glycosyltransferase family 4 protein [Planctomycetota bacterium]|nr:glycosyltransferase family 4 protein [Planctomycetota bacterium]
MRILFVTASYPPDSVGGVELHVQGLCRALTELGHEPFVLARTGRPGMQHLETTRDSVDGVEVTRLCNTFADATSLPAMVSGEPLADVFARELARIRPDVVHVHHLTCLSTRIIDRCREAGVPVVMTLHDFWMGCPRGQRITAALDLCPTIRLEKCLPCLRELWPHLLGRGASPGTAAEERDARDLARLEEYHATIRATLAACSLLVTPSAFLRRMYLDYGVPPAHIVVVENGLPVERWRRALAGQPRRRRGSGPLRVAFIGSVLPSKGPHLLLEAVRRLGDPAAFHVDVWGEVLPFHHDRNYGERLQQLRRGVEAEVELHGAYRNEDLPGILARADVAVVPSLWYEAFGLTIREAFLAGVPVVASGHGALAEAVEDGRTGLLFAPGDAASLADALRRLRDDPALAERLAAAAAGHVRDEGDAARQLLGLYDRVRTGGPGAPGAGARA